MGDPNPSAKKLAQFGLGFFFSGVVCLGIGFALGVKDSILWLFGVGAILSVIGSAVSRSACVAYAEGKNLKSSVYGQLGLVAPPIGLLIVYFEKAKVSPNEER
jgi:hypothetical protein